MSQEVGYWPWNKMPSRRRHKWIDKPINIEVPAPDVERHGARRLGYENQGDQCQTLAQVFEAWKYKQLSTHVPQSSNQKPGGIQPYEGVRSKDILSSGFYPLMHHQLPSKLQCVSYLRGAQIQKNAAFFRLLMTCSSFEKFCHSGNLCLVTESPLSALAAWRS